MYNSSREQKYKPRGVYPEFGANISDEDRDEMLDKSRKEKDEERKKYETDKAAYTEAIARHEAAMRKLENAAANFDSAEEARYARIVAESKKILDSYGPFGPQKPKWMKDIDALKGWADSAKARSQVSSSGYRQVYR